MKMTRAGRIISWFFLLLCFTAFCFWLEANITQMLDADMSSELVLSDLLRQEGGILSTNWYYSTELMVINTQLLFTFLMHFFESWHVVRVVGTILLFVFLLASAYYLCRQVGVRYYFPLVGLLLFVPLTVLYLQIMEIGIFYIAPACYSFLILGMVMHYQKAVSRRSRIILLVLLVLTAFAAGLDGLRLMLMLFLPLGLSAAVLALQKKGSARLGQACCAAFLPALIGVGINRFFLSTKYHITHNELSFRSFNSDILSTIFSDWLKSMGYSAGNVFSFTLIQNLLALALVLLTLFATVRLCSAKSDVPGEQRLLGWVYVIGYVLFVALYLLTDQFYADRYHLSLTVLAFPLIAIGLSMLPFRPCWRRICCALLALVLVVCGGQVCQSFLAYRDTEEFVSLAEELDDAGFTYGYSTFWRSGNLMTELTDGRIEMHIWPPSSTMADIDDTYEWLQKVSHGTQHPEGEFFLMFREKDLTTFVEIYPYLDPGDIFSVSDNYVVYAYDSYEDFQEKLAEAMAE